MSGCPLERPQEPGIEDRGFAGYPEQLLEAIRGPLGDLHDPAADSSSRKRNAHLIADRDARVLGDAVPEAAVDGEACDVGDDPGGRCFQRPASEAIGSARSVRSQLKAGRPKWP